MVVSERSSACTRWKGRGAAVFVREEPSANCCSERRPGRCRRRPGEGGQVGCLNDTMTGSPGSSARFWGDGRGAGGSRVPRGRGDGPGAVYSSLAATGREQVSEVAGSTAATRCAWAMRRVLLGAAKRAMT